jgi:hypothetical protein
LFVPQDWQILQILFPNIDPLLDLDEVEEGRQSCWISVRDAQMVVFFKADFISLSNFNLSIDSFQ